MRQFVLRYHFLQLSNMYHAFFPLTYLRIVVYLLLHSQFRLILTPAHPNLIHDAYIHQTQSHQTFAKIDPMYRVSIASYPHTNFYEKYDGKAANTDEKIHNSSLKT